MNILRFLVPKSAVEYITSDATVRQAFEKMRYHRYVAIPVLDDEGIYIGTLRSDDIYEYFLDNGKVDYRAAERDGLIKILDKNYYPPLAHSASVEDMIEYVNEHNFVPVVDDRGCFIGIILRRDVLRFLFNCYKEAKSEEQ
jgi:CBS domain-containing protein